MTPSKRLALTCIGLFLVSWLFFLLQIQFPAKQNFDEFHYVPSAKQFLELRENQNWEHPPLGKELMAVGIAAFGDRPIGWRFMSTVFGALTLVGMYLWALALFRDDRIAAWVAAITLVNHLLYVQARIGMLDTFMFAFTTWGLAAFTQAWSTRVESGRAYRLLLFAGVMFGLSVATKWAAVVPWIACLILVATLRLFQSWSITFLKPSNPREEEFYHPKLWAGISAPKILIALVLVPLAVYFLTFLPYLAVNRSPAYTLWDLVLMQPKMWDGQLRVVSPHPYMSTWLQWPLLQRPIWYAFDKEGPAQQWVRGVLLVGNPLVLWAGLVAVLVCLWEWLAARSRSAFLIAYFYAALYLCWAVIPRKVAFFYYYYPAGMILGLALGYVFRRWDRTERGRWAFALVAAGIFVYFYPILAGIRIPSESFRKWMWFSGWI